MNERTPALTTRMEHTLNRAGDLALARRHDYIGTEHVLLALLEDSDGIAGGVIHRLGYEAEIREEVTRILESDGYMRGSTS